MGERWLLVLARLSDALAEAGELELAEQIDPYWNAEGEDWVALDPQTAKRIRDDVMARINGDGAAYP